MLARVRTPPQAEIYAPEFPRGLEWLNVAFLRMNTLMGRGAVLVEFWDFARVNSLRTMPYLKAWHERYRDHGLRVIGVHSPGYSFGRDAATVAARSLCQSPRRLATTHAASGRNSAVSSGIACGMSATSRRPGLMPMWYAIVEAEWPSA